ncbi:MAG: thioredoxin family protein [Planctomycetota bacterium]|jgi:thioredoxin 1
MKRVISALAGAVVLSLLTVGPGGAQEVTGDGPQIVDTTYPNLAAGALTFARLSELPEGILMRAGDIDLGMADINSFIAGRPRKFQEQLKSNPFFVLEQEAQARLMLELAKKAAETDSEKTTTQKDAEIIRGYEKGLTEKVTVSDDDIVRFYKENETMFCCTPLEKIKDLLKPHVLKAKKQRLMSEHIRTMGQRMDIVVAASWAKQQAQRASDNPVAKSRTSNKPTLAVFSGASCCGKDRMLAVVTALRKRYTERLNIVHIDARANYVLAARYGVYSVPTNVFFDKTGKEVLRHVGLLSEKQFDDKLSQAAL